MIIELSVIACVLTSTALIFKGFSAVSAIHVRFDRLEQKVDSSCEVIDKIEKELLRRNYL